MSKGKRPEDIAAVTSADCAGRQALVTGSTSGIGRAVALALGRLGANVLVHGRDRSAGRAVVDELSVLGAEARFIEADFSDMNAVRALAATVRSETDGLDLLINNAGGMFRKGRRTSLGVERTFQINHLAPYLLTTALLDHLSEEARIVVTASAAHQGVSLDLTRVQRVESYSPFWAYSHSKLANVLFASELARRLDAADRSITANSVHPGAIPGSGFSRFLPSPLPKAVQKLDTLPGVTSVADGAAALLFVAVSRRTAGVSGRYFDGQQPTMPSMGGRDLDAAERLWRRSAAFLGIDEPLATYGTEVGSGEAN